MKFKSWLRPPTFVSDTPPDIPDKIRMFGLDYRVEDTHPFLDIPNKAFDPKRMKEQIDLSLKYFIKTLKTFDGSLVNKISELHTKINEDINLAKRFEFDNLIKEKKNRKIFEKKEILDKINKVIKE